MSLGATWAGAHVEHAVELDAWACDTLRANHDDGLRVHQKDTTQLTDAWILAEMQRYPDVIIGGPPCQGFSHAGVRTQDPKDPRNSLFREFVRFVRVLEPRSVVIENVPGILRARTAEKQPVQQIIREELEKLGYHVEIVVLNAEEYGVPQIRRRVFFLASLEALPSAPLRSHGDASLFDADRRPVRTVRDAISDLPIVDVGFKGPLITYDGTPLNEFQALMRRGAGESLANHLPMRHSPRLIARFAAIAPGQSQADVVQEHAPSRRLRSADAAPAAYDQNSRRQFWDRPCHTLAASFYANFLHPELHRNFTPREGARIQSFPDSYVFHGKPTVVSQKLLAREGRHAERHLCQYNQIGNAVPPLLGKAVLEAIVGTARRSDERAEAAA